MHRGNRAILPSGLLSQKSDPAYKPTPINVTLPAANKPAPGFINIDKVKAESDRRYAEQQAQQQAQASQGGGKIICQAYHQLGILSDEQNVLDQAYGAWLMKSNPRWQKAYWRYARHIVKYLHRNDWKGKTLIFVLTPLVKVWAQEMCYRMGGNYKHSRLGSILMWLMVRFFMTLGDIRNFRLRLARQINRFFKRISVFSQC